MLLFSHFIGSVNSAEKISKSVHVCQSYSKPTVGRFLRRGVQSGTGKKGNGKREKEKKGHGKKGNGNKGNTPGPGKEGNGKKGNLGKESQAVKHATEQPELIVGFVPCRRFCRNV